MKKLITPLLFLLFSLSSFAQTATNDYYNPKPKLASKDRVSVSITAGTGFSVGKSPNNSFYSSYVAPKIGYQLTPKFKLNVGLMHYALSGNTFMQVNPNESFLNATNRFVSGNLIFVEGQYQLSPRLIVSGAVMHSVNNANVFNTQQTNFNATSLGFQYKVSDKASIGIRTTFSQGNPNYNNNMNPTMPGSTGFSGGLSPIGMFPAFGQY
jgi:hypothetical protein